MHRIDSDAATDDNRFTDGDPTIPIAATVVDAAWLNAVQGEIVGVIEAAGITLNKESTTQLNDALEIMLAQWTPAATEDVAGIVKLATEALALAGVDDTTAMTPATTKATVDACRASDEDVATGTSTTKFPNVAQLVEAIASVDSSYRLSRIGTAHAMAGITLPSGYMWGDGTLVYFEDYPELEEAYNNGYLLVLGSDSTADEQSAQPMAFVERSDGTGLYLPRLAGLFARAWTGTDDGTAGGYNEAGLPDIKGSASATGSVTFASFSSLTGAFYSNSNGAYTTGTAIYGKNCFSFKASGSNSIYGNSDTTMPESYNQPYAIYLGQPAVTE